MGVIKHVFNALTSGEEPDCTCLVSEERTDGNILIKRYDRDVVVDPGCLQGHAFNKGDNRKGGGDKGKGKGDKNK